MLEDLEITKIIRKVPLGVTNPYLVECNDGKKYLAKFPGNPDGTKVLINEYVCAELAKELNLPIPNFKLVKIKNIENDKDILTDIELKNGTVYCSEWIEKANPVPGYYVLTKITNRYDPIKILIFDVIIGNNDRNKGNLLINFKNNSLIMIDHSHVFIHEALWNERNLNELIGKEINFEDMNQFSFEILISCLNNKDYKKDIKKYIFSIKSINNEKLDNILKKIPTDWKITENEKDSLKNFLLDRIKRIDEICELLGIERGD